MAEYCRRNKKSIPERHGSDAPRSIARSIAVCFVRTAYWTVRLTVVVWLVVPEVAVTVMAEVPAGVVVLA